jgi:hypothetical protein
MSFFRRSVTRMIPGPKDGLRHHPGDPIEENFYDPTI